MVNIAKTAGIREEQVNLVVSQDAEGECWEVPTSAATRYLSHDYYRYIGKFPPQIAARLLEQYSSAGDLILDPMCGGGTALIEARIRMRRGLGFDVNPVSVLLSRVATRALPHDALERDVTSMLDDLRGEISLQRSLPLLNRTRTPSSTLSHPELPDMFGHEKYFDEETLKGLRAFFGRLAEVRDPMNREFILVGLLAILRSISYANVKKMNLELDLEKRTRRPLLEALEKKLARMSMINRELKDAFGAAAPEITQGSAEKTLLETDSVDFVIIHPPYLSNTAFSEATQLQLAVLGTSHLKIWRKELRARGSFLHEPDGVRKYIVGWNRILREMHRALRPNAFCAVVIGDGQVDFTRIPMGAITLELAKDMGFGVEATSRHKLNHNTGKSLSRKMRDQHVIVLKK